MEVHSTLGSSQRGENGFGSTEQQEKQKTSKQT
jgi:dUTPase